MKQKAVVSLIAAALVQAAAASPAQDVILRVTPEREYIYKLGARELIVELKDRGGTIVLASSAKEDEVDHYLDLLEARDLADGWTSSADVEETKPEPDLVHAAIEKAGGGEAVMLGDTPWDVKAAKKAGVETVAVLTGGFSEQEVREAGAVGVFESIAELRERLDETPFR